MSSKKRTVSVVLFDGFQPLDAIGPVELFRMIPDPWDVTFLAPVAGPVVSALGSEMVANVSFDRAPVADIVLVPGGIGTRHLATDRMFLRWLRDWASQARLVTSVCTGSALLAASGLLEGYAATSNKRAYEWATSFGFDVDWRPHARWVEDRDRWTSSGVAAGMDMAAALIAHVCGPDVRDETARRIELEFQTDPTRDPFAREDR